MQRQQSVRTLRNVQQRHRDGAEHQLIEHGARHMQTRTFTCAGFAAVFLGGRMARVIGDMRCRWHVLFALFMFRTARVIRGVRGHVGRHLMMPGRAHVICVIHRHGMTQLADDQTAHQQENQGQTLPEKLRHGQRVPFDVASRNDTPTGSPSSSTPVRHLLLQDVGVC